MLGSIARRFVVLLKPLAKAAGKWLLYAGTSFVSDVIDGKPIGVAVRNGLKKFTKIRNKKRCRNDPAIIPKKRRWCKQEIFFMMTEGLTNALNLFLAPPIQTSIIQGSWVEARPTN